MTHVDTIPLPVTVAEVKAERFRLEGLLERVERAAASTRVLAAKRVGTEFEGRWQDHVRDWVTIIRQYVIQIEALRMAERVLSTDVEALSERF